MKNLVLETQGKYAVILNENGEFKKIRNKGYKAGQRIESKAQSVKPGLLRHIAIIAAVFAVLIGASSAYACFTPFSEVSIDINPSVVMRMNFFNNVLDVTSMNEDAQALLDGINLKNTDLETALKTLVDALKQEGYLASDQEAEIMISTYSDNDMRAKNMLQNVEKFLEREMERQQVQAEVQGEQVGEELRDRARELGVSPVKLMLAERCAQALGDTSDAKIQELLGKSVKEVQALIKAEKKNDKARQGEEDDSQTDADEQTGEASDAAGAKGKGNQDKDTKSNGSDNQSKNNGNGNGSAQNKGKKDADNKGNGNKQAGAAAGSSNTADSET